MGGNYNTNPNPNPTAPAAAPAIGFPSQPVVAATQLQRHNQNHAWDQIQLVIESWNPHSPLCQFRHYFYNLVDPAQVGLYTCPPDHDPALWEQAQLENPDPTCLVPALAVGFEDLRKRMDQQETEATAHITKLDEISEKLTQLRHLHQVETLARLAEFRRRNQEHAYRIQRLVKMVQVLRFRGQTLRPEEEVVRVRLEAMLNELTRPGQLQRRSQDLWTQTQTGLAQRRGQGNGGRVCATQHGNIRYEVASDVDLETCVNLLDNYQAGLTQFTGIVQQHLVDTKSLCDKFRPS
ncbi:nucleoporin complex subunit 54-domain-containing protein [Dimargaris cristalligena]|uniref:Nucleoporin complex subunit 54-domain-containing protein n=1 Tax=Dimargaris cristalligena TaxID=215637 RepID=A0A4P9ZT06_9FUNG|nr:nucleoporin complex subunit 54-domain-containing protein [Dimargaris cristalligena]|eukprot:RKP36716.1 nucleoporin complex subunit 54-domain-containing protein [Dimargaris cristalligena]